MPFEKTVRIGASFSPSFLRCFSEWEWVGLLEVGHWSFLPRVFGVEDEMGWGWRWRRRGGDERQRMRVGRGD